MQIQPTDESVENVEPFLGVINVGDCVEVDQVEGNE